MPSARSDQVRRALLLIALPLAGALHGACDDPAVGATVRVFIDTDAPVAGGEELGMPPALFDRVRVDVYRGGADDPCDGCTQILALEHALLAGEEGVSFGLGVRAGEAGTRIRARAYRSDAYPDGNPPLRATLDVVFELPVLEDDDARDFTLLLPTDETGDPESSLGRPRAASEGRPDGTRAGTWKHAQRSSCAGAPWPGQVCVPGGAFWMSAVFGDKVGLTPYEEQLVVLSPYFVDRTETTVGDVLRSGWLTDPDAIMGWSGDEEGVELGYFFDWCTFSGSGERLNLPLNCARADWARSYCQARGADLPSEAQVSYVTGGLRSRAHPWGNEDPSCDDAWLARVQFGAGPAGAQAYRLECATLAFDPFQPVATSARDRVEVEDGVFVEDILGNAAELTRDRFTTLADACWGTAWIRDPTCDPSSVADARLVGRGGSIAAQLASAAHYRGFVPLDGQGIDVGFRCVRPGDSPAPPPVELDIVLGQGCTVDTDCGTSAGARCIGPDDVSLPSGGIVGGYCSRDCQTESDCPATGDCAAGLCLLACDANDPPITFTDEPLPVTKCHGRRDLVCRSLQEAPGGVCLGACGSDAQCSEGDHCDRKIGGCRASASPGLPDGSACEDDGDCQGYCVYGANGLAICASACSAGGEIDSEDCGGSAQGLCYAAGEYQAVGSLGFCYGACTTHAECGHPNAFCVPVAYEEGFIETPWWEVADAICFEAKECSGPGESCGGGLVCQATPDGDYCLDPDIPWE